MAGARQEAGRGTRFLYFPVKAVLYILFGWALTSMTAWALGSLLLRRLRLRLDRLEESVLGFIAGAPCLSALIFVLCSCHLVYKGVLLFIAAASIALALKSRPCTPPEPPPSSSPLRWKVIFGGVFGAFSVLYFFNALAPETSPDGASYHIPIASLFYRAHGFVPVPWNMFGNLSLGIELIFMMAFAFGRHSAAAMVHLSFLLTLPWMMLAFGRRWGFPTAGAAAGLMVFASPVLGIDGTSAYNDVALAAVVFGTYYFLTLWDGERSIHLLIPAGLLAGFAFATKYTGVVAVPYALLYVAWKTRHSRADMLRATMAVGLCAFAMIAPWLLKNWLLVQNPVAPFANNIFPNPYFHISAEQDVREYLKTYGLETFRSLPMELAVRGQRLSGVFGPLFLLAPLALLALRTAVGRGVLLAALVFASTYFTNVGARFLIPVLPFLSIALALALASVPGLSIILVLAHALSSWPSLMGVYCSQYAWRLQGIPIKGAFRRPSEDAYLGRTWPPYLVDRMLEAQVGPADKVFSFGSIAESYTSRRVLVNTQAASNEVLGDMLYTAMFNDFQPNKIVDFRFAERKVQRVRVIQTATLPKEQWSVAEFRVFDHGRELSRGSGWRLKASPNPWDVQLAFDNALVTRWRSWEHARPGMFMEVDFGELTSVDEVRLQTSENPGIRLRLEGLGDQPVETTRTDSLDFRRDATQELKRRGVGFILIESSTYDSEAFFQHAPKWGLKEVARQGETRLYRIE